MYDEGVDPNWEYYLETGEDPTDGELSGEEAADLDLHGDMLGLSNRDIRILGAYSAILNGSTLKYAMKKFGITEKEYNENINRVLNEC